MTATTRKRNRSTVSCEPCRLAKRRCSRTLPCESCVRRGAEDECVFDPDAKIRPEQQQDRRPKIILPVRSESSTIGKDIKEGMKGEVKGDTEMNDRIHRLEDLVLSFMKQQAVPSHAQLPELSIAPSSQDPKDDLKRETDSPEQLGTLSGKIESSVYHSEGHWASILSDIAAIKTYITDGKKPFPDSQPLPVSLNRASNPISPPIYLFSGGDIPHLTDIRATLPSIEMMDMLVMRYLGTNDHTAILLHGPSFLKDYQKHRNTLWDMDPEFLALLYAIMCIAMSSYHYKGDEPAEFIGRTLQIAARYRSMIQKCLLLADWAQPSRRMLQVLMLHKYGDYLKGRDASLDDWIYEGIIIRLAMRQGYHRDPRHFPTIKPFEAEMRRRIWTTIRTSDILHSWQIGLPGMIRSDVCDTEPPSNLYDEDFDVDTVKLPPSRSLQTCKTPVSYSIIKSKLILVFGSLMDRLHSQRSCTPEERGKLHSELIRAWDAIPEYLKWRPLEETPTTDSPKLIFDRFFISLIFHRARCVLHRQGVARSTLIQPDMLSSKQLCLDSATTLLSHQKVLISESRASGRLASMRWIIKTLAADYLFAAALVYLELKQPKESEQISPKDRRDLESALQTSCHMWQDLIQDNQYATKAVVILKRMLQTLGRTSLPSEDIRTTHVATKHPSSMTDAATNFDTLGDPNNLAQDPGIGFDAFSFLQGANAEGMAAFETNMEPGGMDLSLFNSFIAQDFPDMGVYYANGFTD